MKIGPWNINFERSSQKVSPPEPNKSPTVAVPGGRVSKVDLPNAYVDFNDAYSYLTPQRYVDYVETVRNAAPFIQNLSLAISDLVQLSNTGHTVYFDNKTKPELVNEMRQALLDDAKLWLDGGAGIDSIINKTLSQLFIGGAISNEWVPKTDLSGIDYVALINPERIRFKVNRATGRFEAYQLLKYQSISTISTDPLNLIRLNSNTYKYYALGGDTEDPYGVPPLVSALEDLGIQKDMVKNIAYIVKQLGVMGFIELLLEKPVQAKNETDAQYKTRLTQLLTESKNNMASGTKDGLLVGYKEDHTYEFHSTTQNVSGLGDVFGIIQNLVANGLKYSNSFLGSQGGAETNITVIFTKMLSQLRNIQSLVKANLEFGYSLHLRLKGYNFKNLTVEFNPSTITDDLKMQQATEIKIRNSRLLYADGIISMQGYAENLGYESPDQSEPRAPIDPDGMLAKQAQEKAREEGKDASDRKVREKNKPQPKRKDQSSNTDLDD